MTINEAIAHARDVAVKRRSASAEWLEQSNEEGSIEEEISKRCEKCAQEHEQLANWLEELKQYQAIGTLEECRVAVEKQKPMKPIKTETEGYMFTDTYRCPTCGGNFSGTGIADYCYHCGQKLDWSDPDDKLD